MHLYNTIISNMSNLNCKPSTSIMKTNHFLHGVGNKKTALTP